MQNSTFTQLLILIIQRWKWIAAGAGVTVVVVAAFLLSQRPVYVASVSIVPKRARTEVNYETRIRTVSADSAAQSGQPGFGAITPERRQALAQLVRGLEIEQDVRTQLGDRLPEDLRVPGRLTRLVQGRVVPRSEIIAIDISAPGASLADDVAVAWSEAYERRINYLYGSTPFGADKFETELAEAKHKYEAADTVFTSFLATSQLAEFTRSFESKQRLLKELLSLRQAQVADLYKIAHRVDLLLSQAEALQEQLSLAQDNGSAATSAAALTLLKTQVFASSMVLATDLQVQLPRPPVQTAQNSSTTTAALPGAPAASADPTADLAATLRALQDWALPANVQIQVAATAAPTLLEQRSDIAGTIRALTDWRERIGQAQQEGRGLRSGDGTDTAAYLDQAIAGLETEVRGLQSKIADQGAQQRNLQQERDILWDSYTSLLKKAEEGRVADLVGAGKEVSIAGRTGAEPRSRRLSLLLPLAGLLGAGGVAGWFVMREWVVPVLFAADARSNGVAVVAQDRLVEQGAHTS